MAKTFCHNNEEEGGEGVSLSDSLGGLKRGGWNTIDQNREEGGRNETHDPSYLGMSKTKSN